MATAVRQNICAHLTISEKKKKKKKFVVAVLIQFIWSLFVDISSDIEARRRITTSTIHGLMVTQVERLELQPKNNFYDRS